MHSFTSPSGGEAGWSMSTWNFVTSLSSPVDVSPWMFVVVGWVVARLASYSATVFKRAAWLPSSGASSSSSLSSSWSAAAAAASSSSLLISEIGRLFSLNDFDEVVFRSVNELGVVTLEPPNRALLETRTCLCSAWRSSSYFAPSDASEAANGMDDEPNPPADALEIFERVAVK